MPILLLCKRVLRAFMRKKMPPYVLCVASLKWSGLMQTVSLKYDKGDAYGYGYGPEYGLMEWWLGIMVTICSNNLIEIFLVNLNSLSCH